MQETSQRPAEAEVKRRRIDPELVTTSVTAEAEKIEVAQCVVGSHTPHTFTLSAPTPKDDGLYRVRCAVYEHLWSSGLYVTSASKFGGDFLAYEGKFLSDVV